MKRLTEQQFQDLVVELADHMAVHVPRGQDIRFAIFMWRPHPTQELEFGIGGTLETIDDFVEKVERWIDHMKKGKASISVKDMRTGVQGTLDWRKVKKGD